MLGFRCPGGELLQLCFRCRQLWGKGQCCGVARFLASDFLEFYRRIAEGGVCLFGGLIFSIEFLVSGLIFDFCKAKIGGERRDVISG